MRPYQDSPLSVYRQHTDPRKLWIGIGPAVSIKNKKAIIPSYPHPSLLINGKRRK